MLVPFVEVMCGGVRREDKEEREAEGWMFVARDCDVRERAERDAVGESMLVVRLLALLWLSVLVLVVTVGVAVVSVVIPNCCSLLSSCSIFAAYDASCSATVHNKARDITSMTQKKSEIAKFCDNQTHSTLSSLLSSLPFPPRLSLLYLHTYVFSAILRLVAVVVVLVVPVARLSSSVHALYP